MIQWEYLRVDKIWRIDAATVLTTYGYLGWELVCIVGDTAIFKRPKP